MLNDRIKDESPWYDGSLLKCGNKSFHMISKEKSNATTFLHCGTKVVASKNQTGNVTIKTKWEKDFHGRMGEYNDLYYNYSFTKDLLETGLYDPLTITRRWTCKGDDVFFIRYTFRKDGVNNTQAFSVIYNVMSHTTKNFAPNVYIDKNLKSAEFVYDDNVPTWTTNDRYTVNYAGRVVSIDDEVMSADATYFSNKSITITV